MITVANHLRQQAIARQSNDDINYFGRSAFNRYYYYAFLSAKSLLVSSGDTDHAMIGHKDLPEYLKGKFLKKAKATLERRLKTKIITENEYFSYKFQLEKSVRDISSTLHGARPIRNICDYSDTPRVSVSGNDIQINGTRGSEAENWGRSILASARTISKVMEQLG